MKQTFLEHLRSHDLHGLAKSLLNATSKDVENILAKGKADNIEEFAVLLSPAATPYLEDMAVLSASITEKYFGKTMRLFAPLYVGNECVNNCVYCGFARRHSIERRTLSLEEVEAEVQAIYDLGFRNILLVAGEHPKLVSSGYIEEAIKIALKKISSVSIEIAPSKEEDYKRYVDCGCEGLTVFQETYDEQVYPILHPSGPKSVYQWRLETPERAARAGMRKIGLGPLLGVNNWYFEVLAVALHAQFLFKNAWRSQISISLPRIRPATSGYVPKPENIPTDRQLVQITCALRIFLSRLAIVVSTRESRKMRDGMMRIGVTQMSAFSSTQPGGYANRDSSGEQFHIDDGRTPKEFAEALQKMGIEPVWKDFDASIVS
ncbi:MAG: 2-iminoacetate synthase ThiH [Verrucomicrobiaceae bacterium]|nr:2-iminoacetate synthase ThiH [Verrucomicrobiaceae bacterium]